MININFNNFKRKNLLYFFGILYIVCLWAIANVNGSAVDVVTGQTSNEDCPYQALPSTLNDMNYLNFSGEFHIHETYYYDFSAFQKIITFTLEQDSAFRVYVAPHVVDIDLWLFDSNSQKSINHTSDATVGGDENLYANLNAGSYTLKFLFFGQNKGKKLACPTIDLEIAVTPLSIMQNRVNNYKVCQGQTKSYLPTLQVTTDKLPFVYDSDIDSNKPFFVIDSYNKDSEVNIITSYTINLPDTQPKYSIDVSLGFEFLTGGSLNVLIQESEVPNPVEKLPCLGVNNCTIGVHTAKSHSNIKTVLYPGTYTLFIYDQTQEKDFAISPPCTEFSLYVKVDKAQQVEDFLNCQEYELPVSFNEPGFLNDGGYLYFDEDILIDLSVTSEEIPFTIKEKSYFRAYVPDYRIDIDIKLVSVDPVTNATKVVVSSFKFGGEEEIQAVIDAGQYKFQLLYFGKKADVFCDTYALEVEIQPISDFINLCTTHNNITPPISQINSTLADSGSYYLGYTDKGGVAPEIYQYLPTPSIYKAQTIESTEFTIADDEVYLFESILESSFATADIRLVIVDLKTADTSDILYVGTHDRNRHAISLYLYPGNFSLQIQTGTNSQGQSQNLPSCFAYSLAIRITKQDKSRPSCDMISKELPTNLNTPAYLGSSKHVQIAGEFYFPPSDFVLYSNDEIAFTPEEDSILRAYTQYNSIDIDMTLYESGSPVAWTSKFYEEEALVYTLKANVSYKLRLKYIHIGSVSSCIPYYFVLTISPKADNPVDTCSTIDNVPTSGFIPDASINPYYNKSNFFFRQKNTAADIQVSFNVPTSVGNSLFRAILSSDFIWNNLAFELSSGDSPISNGELNYNRLEILPIELVPGTYTLRIYEPFTNNLEQLELRNCVDFSLEVGLQSKLANSVNDAIICPAVELPNTFNSIGYMSALTSNSLYYAERVLARVEDTRDAVNFTITQKSMLRIYLPYNPELNINVQVLNSKGLPVANSMAMGEDIIYVEITPQQYQIVFQYFGLGGALPRPDDCPSFYAFISIAQTSDLLSPLISDCDDGDSIAVLPNNFTEKSFSQKYSRSLLVKTQPKVITLNSNNWAHLYVNLDYNDLVSSLSMKVEGSYVSANGITVKKTYLPLYQGGEAFLNEVLPPGNWQLSVYDPFSGISPDSSIQCAPFTFSYAVNYTADGGHPGGVCEELAVLPSSFSEIQSFSAKNLLMKKSPVIIPISVTSFTTYIRIFGKTDPGSQVLFNLYKTDADRISGKDPIFSTMSTVVTDSNIWKLDTQSKAYSLVVSFNPNKNSDCSYYDAEIALDHFNNIQQDLLCPVPLPNEVDQVPPDTIRFTLGDDYFINDEYLFTSDRINNNVQKDIFRYRVTLIVVEPVYLDAEVTFGFLSNDFNLVFGKKNADRTDQKYAIGVDFIRVDNKITNKITYQINSAGTYYLDITENMKYNTFNVTNACHDFEFALTSIPVNTTSPPKIFVSPPNRSNVSPDKSLTLTFTFSEEVAFALNGSSLIDFLNNNNAVYLKSGFSVIHPYSASLISKNTQLLINFNGFKSSTSYELSVDVSHFVSARGIMFAALNTTNTYKTFSCECNGRGKCDNPGEMDTTCNCEAPWAGNDCSKCMVGYHGEGEECVPNTSCNSKTCNGHGTCTNPNGVPQCACQVGYNSPNSTALCGDCAFGYEGYPNCKLIPDQEDTYCYAPILPRNLSHIQYLGFNGKVHLQDDFYIDIPSGSHDTFLPIKQPSLLRVYTEPHHVDVDLWLYNVTEDNEMINIVDRSITFNREEVLLSVLQPGFYRISFKYFNWNKVPTSNCETFNLELAIEDLESIKADVDNINQIHSCTNTPAFPQKNEFIPSLITTNVSVSHYDTIYKLDAQPSNQIVYLYNTTFTVAPSQEGFNIMADIELSYQFLIGDISMVLVGGNNSNAVPSCKGSTDTSVSGCVFGDNELNRNVIHSTLYPGDYVLYIYAPEFTDITGLKCVLFNIKTQFTLIKDDEDYFNCLGEPIPTTLNTPEFLGFVDSTGKTGNYLHVQDLYLINKKSAAINFVTTVQTLVRIHAQQLNAVNTISLKNLESGDVFNKHSDTIFMNVAAGSYQLIITSNRIVSSKNFCPLLNLEIAIEPSDTPLLLNDDCPSNNKPSVPAFTVSRIPYIFENGTSRKNIYTVPVDSKQVVATYSFTLNQVSQFYTAVASEFLRGDLRVNLYLKLDDSSLMLTTKGVHDYNYNWIQEDLEAGQYVLKIERPQYEVSNIQANCIPFEFEFSLLPLDKVPMCPGEPIPLDFNSVRFLGSEGRMHYQSDSLVVPQPTGKNSILTSVMVPIGVSKKSVLRLYVNPHIVDIDIKLLDASNNQTIASGSNLINTEESFITVLDKISKSTDTQPKYYILFQFWRWSDKIPACNTFSLEIAVSPIDEINVLTCPSGNTNSNWPVIQTTFNQGATYNYSNVLTNTKLYFQQSTTAPVTQSYTITTKGNSNIHIQVGSNFLTSDISLTLSSNKNKKVYYGVTAPNRNILEVVNLPAGSYTLKISEPYTSTKEVVGCSYFDFEFYLEPYVNLDQEDGFYHYLPETLNTYAYLNYNNHVHLQGEYMMYDGIAAHNKVDFVLFEKSLVRVQASILPDNEVNTFNETNIPTVYVTDGKGNKVSAATFGSYVNVLEAGDYTLHFDKGFFSVENVPVDVEIEIALVAQVEKYIQNIPYPENCTLSPPISITPSKEDGTFYYHEMLTIPSAKMTTSTIINISTFKLAIPSKVYIQIGYQFLLGDLNVQITNDDVTINFIGKANRNTNEINAELPPGTYNLVITSIGGIPSTITPHCTPYNLAIIIREISSDTHTDCSIYNAIPWDLNSPNGGSTQFGGPLDDNGFVRIYSDDFIAPSNAAQRNISFAVSQDTLVNVFTIDALAAYIDTDVFTQDTNIDQDLIFYSSLHNNAQRSYVYLAKAGDRYTKFDISLDFSGISKGSCPAFGLQIITKPVSYLTNQLLCPASFSSRLPTSSPKLDSHGTFIEYISSYFTGDYISKHQVNTVFEYYIDFDLQNTSRIEASFSYDSIASNFFLKLASRNGNTRSLIGTADWTAELSYGETSMTSIIANSNLQAGKYSLVISHPPAINPLVESSSVYNDLCLPFTYSLVIMNNSQVYVGSFSPPNGHNIVPTRDLVLLFTTENTHYDVNRTQIVCGQNQTIANSFYLASQTSSDKVYPSVLCLQEDGTKWQMTFPHDELDPDTTYILTLTPNSIFNQDGTPSILPPQNVYNFLDTSCSNNGGFQDDRCVCSKGYNGIDCGQCDKNYYNINHDSSGSPICVSNSCTQNYCNCDPSITATCISLGNCLINKDTDMAYCVCSKQYNGTTCNTCANGYINYPYCEPHFECGSCGKGSCDYTTGQCKCPSNFQGSNCNECAEGYHGKDCSKNGSGAIIALEVIATLIAVSIVIGVGIWYVRTRYRSGVARYKMLPKFEFDDDRTTKFPGLYDDEEDDLQFNGDKKDTSINRGGGKTHVFSFSSMPVSALDSDDSDEERLTASNNAKNQNNNKHLFDM